MILKADIVIVGGGMAGFAAAMAASSENKKVILLDKDTSLGGNSVHANVGTICGAYYRTLSGNAKPVGYPFCHSFLQALKNEDSNASSYMYTDGLYIIPYEWSLLQRLYQRMLHQNNVTAMVGTTLQEVNVNNSNIENIVVSQNEKSITIQAACFIDGSGQAIISQLAGIETIKEEVYQAASQLFRVTHVSSSNEFSLNMALKRSVMRRMEEMNWPASYTSLSVVPGSLRDNHVDLKLTLPDKITDDSMFGSALTETSHTRVRELFSVLQKEVASLSDAVIEMIFPQPGVRVVQRSKGKYILTEEDVLQCQQTHDGIAIGTWPIEEWNSDGKLKMEYFNPDQGYSIPAGCLVSDTLNNLFFAGKTISATARAIASARVMGTVLQTGYAAGKIASASTETERIKIVKALHHELE